MLVTRGTRPHDETSSIPYKRLSCFRWRTLRALVRHTEGACVEKGTENTPTCTGRERKS